MSEAKLYGDRYHYTQFNFSLTEHSRGPDEELLFSKPSVFYATQRKKRFAPCVGHERLRKNIVEMALGVPRLRFLNADKAGLDLAAQKLSLPEFPFQIRTAEPGRIMFAGEPFADITGPFGMNQMMEIKFEHAFDMPMTVAANALEIRLAADIRHASDFSNRRNSDEETSVEVAKFSYIGGLDDTSNMEAAFLVDLNATGTMAHYTVEAFTEWMNKIVPLKHKNGDAKHPQEITFERWLDAHPQGTTLLIDTYSVKMGIIHAVRAAKSSPIRRKALKFVRIDSGDLIANAKFVRAMLEANDLAEVGIILTSDLDADCIREIVAACPFVAGFGIGTKLHAETRVAGVIFKLCQIGHYATMKCSETKEKSTLPGPTQVWRCVDENGRYVKDIITMSNERPNGYFQIIPIIKQFNGPRQNMPIPTPQKQREFVFEQLSKFDDIENYPVELSQSLKISQENLMAKLCYDERGAAGVVMVYPG